MKRIIAATASVVMAASALMFTGSAQAVPGDFEWLGSVNGTVAVANVSASSQVTMLANGSTVVMAYQEANDLVLATSPEEPGPGFSELTRIELPVGLSLIGKPRLDAGVNGSTIVSFISRTDAEFGELTVLVVQGDGTVTMDRTLAGVRYAHGYDLGVAASGIITVTFLQDDRGGNQLRVTTLRDGDIDTQLLESGLLLESPRIEVDTTGQALVIFKNADAANPDRGTLFGWTRSGPTLDAPFDPLPRPFYDGGAVATWDVDGDGSGSVTLFVHDPVNSGLRASTGTTGGADWSVPQVIDGPATNQRVIKVVTSGPDQNTYFWRTTPRPGFELVLTRPRSTANPGSGTLVNLGQFIEPSGPASQITGLDSQGLPWLVRSAATDASEDPYLYGATSSVDPRDPNRVELRTDIVGMAPLGITTADAVALDNGSMLAAWVAFVDNQTTIFTRWMAPPPVVPATNVAGEVLDDRSVRVTWTNSAQAAGTNIAANDVLAYRIGVPGIWDQCQASAIATECTFPIGEGAGSLQEGFSYQFTVRTTSTAGDTVDSPLSAAVTIPVDPGPGPGPDPGAESILISGTRGEVRGKRGIIVNGTTTGLVGATVMPRYKFPGQVEYSDGVARRTVAADGTFDWQRRTGKKIYIIFKTVDGSVQSPRIIIR